jgi:HSP20 family protein
MRRLSDDMDQLFGQLSRGVLPLAAQRSDAAQVEWLPALEISERDGKLVVQADLPGLGADDVTVEVTDGVLTLSGERLEERETGGDGVRRTERRYGRFSRSLALPEGAQTEDIQASFRNGVLEITIPLSQPTTQRRTVDVQGASRKETRSSNGETGVSAGQSASQRGDAPEVSSASRAAPAT